MYLWLYKLLLNYIIIKNINNKYHYYIYFLVVLFITTFFLSLLVNSLLINSNLIFSSSSVLTSKSIVLSWLKLFNVSNLLIWLLKISLTLSSKISKLKVALLQLTFSPSFNK